MHPVRPVGTNACLLVMELQRSSTMNSTLYQANALYVVQDELVATRHLHESLLLLLVAFADLKQAEVAVLAPNVATVVRASSFPGRQQQRVSSSSS